MDSRSMLKRITDLFGRRPPGDEHGEVRNLSSDFIDEELDRKARRKVETHMEWCPPCRDFVNTLRATVGLLWSTEKKKAPASFVKRMRDESPWKEDAK